MTKVIIIVFLYTFSAFSLNAQGVKFTEDTNWNVVLQEAKSNDKFIFLDLYATWCKPCKMMDAEIFSDNQVGRLLNNKFISVKVQTDRTADDNELIRTWYADAAMLSKKYHIEGLPTQIILSADGDILYQHAGYNGVDNFIRMIKFAIDPKANNFRQKLVAYKAGQKDYLNLPALIQSTRLINDQELTHKMVRDYMENHLNKVVSPSNVITPENISVALIDQDGLKPYDRIITDIRRVGYNVSDSLSKSDKGTCLELVQKAVQNVELEDKLWKYGKVINSNPDFDKFERLIRKKYPDLDAKELINIYQRGYVITPGFYRRAGNFAMMNKVIGLEIQRHLPDNINVVNNWCWFTYFRKVNNKPSLSLAIKWINQAINIVSKDDTKIFIGDKVNLYDTKAALLYKLGYRNAAISTEQKGIAILKADNVSKGQDENGGCKGFLNTIEQMKKGLKIDEPEAIYANDWKLYD